jgi:nicotinate dehydrogenase subunit B
MSKHDYTRFDFYDTDREFSLGRRDFLKLVGGGIVILFSVGDPYLLEAQRRGQPLPDDFNAFLRIGEDGRVTGFTGKVELGQGVITSLAQMLADELNVSLDSVDMIMGDTDLCPWDMGTFGSMTTRFFGPPFRAAAAEAREVLLKMAAESLQVPVNRLQAKDGVIFDTEQKDKRIGYGELAKGQKIARRLEEKAVLEAVRDFTVVGKPVLRRDAVEKASGKAIYAGDVREPGMLYARILRPPAHDAKRLSLDTSDAKKIKGVQVIEDGDLVAVLSEDPELAGHALQQVRAEYERADSSVDDKTIFEHLLKVAPEGEVVSEGGELAVGEKEAKFVIDKTYLDGYVAHAPIEPHTTMAKMENGRVIIRSSTQTPFSVKSQAAETLGVPEDRVRVIPPYVGGGFGGKTSNREAIEAVRLAKLTGKPVQVAWTRAEEFFYDTFRPAAVVKIKAGVAETGSISLWDYGVYFAGERGSQHYYNIPHHRTTAYSGGWRGAPGSHPFSTGAWRAPSNNTNTFARESHIDILASQAGIDPLEFRLKNLKDKRMIRVLETVAKKFGWTPHKTPSGRGYGISTGIDAGTYVAHMSEVLVDKKTGRVKVERIVCAQDMGLSINPEGSIIQMEGCITMGLGYALAEDIQFNGGEILNKNFDTYDIPRFSWLPKIETVLIDDKEAAPQGGGEPAIICMGGVIANAIFDAVGARVLQMPMTPERVLKALS